MNKCSYSRLNFSQFQSEFLGNSSWWKLSSYILFYTKHCYIIIFMFLILYTPFCEDLWFNLCIVYYRGKYQQIPCLTSNPNPNPCTLSSPVQLHKRYGYIRSLRNDLLLRYRNKGYIRGSDKRLLQHIITNWTNYIIYSQINQPIVEMQPSPWVIKSTELLSALKRIWWITG